MPQVLKNFQFRWIFLSKVSLITFLNQVFSEKIVVCLVLLMAWITVDLDQSVSEEEIVENKVPCEQIFLECTLTLSVPRRCFFFGSFLLFMLCVCRACCLICSLQPCGHLLGKGFGLLALLCVMFSCGFVTLPCGVLGQVWYLIVLIPDLYLLPCYNWLTLDKKGQDQPCSL